MPDPNDKIARAQLKITEDEARRVANLLRYAVSLNTTAGLVSPTQRRLASSTYKAVELAALILEGSTFEEAIEESNKAWTGSLEEDHRRALQVLESERDALRDAMSSRLTPEQLAEYLEVAQDQFLELVRQNVAKGTGTETHES
ncbi:MAG: hypothetical protein M3358_09445 [Actinomycetota bacterium]|nr:hypothetical protein [Actinomycetota bacterium]